MSVTLLLTWPAYGTWLPGRARGWIERGDLTPSDDVPEPDRELTAARRRSLAWPPVCLTAPQRSRLAQDIHRLATLRRFVPMVVVIAADHLHLLVERDEIDDVPRFVQLVKGSLSRTLTRGEGDPPPPPTRGHHTWWGGHYSVRLAHESVRDRLQLHVDADVSSFRKSRT